MRGNGLAVAVVALSLVASAPGAAQETDPVDRTELPAWGEAGLDGVYPARLLTIESGHVMDGGDAILGLGDARWAHPDRSFELVTNTLSDILGIANLGVKVGVLQGQDGGVALAVGGKGYWSYGGLIDVGVREIARSFAEVTDSRVEVFGFVGYATATWPARRARTHHHASVQVHRPLASKFRVEDSEAGGGGSIEFHGGEDVSAMWGADHALFGRGLILLLEAGYSWGLDRPRFGVGFDAGGERLRFLLGMTYPGVETDLATEPRDFVVNPALSVHWRF